MYKANHPFHVERTFFVANNGFLVFKYNASEAFQSLFPETNCIFRILSCCRDDIFFTHKCSSLQCMHTYEGLTGRKNYQYECNQYSFHLAVDPTHGSDCLPLVVMTFFLHPVCNEKNLLRKLSVITYEHEIKMSLEDMG